MSKVQTRARAAAAARLAYFVRRLLLDLIGIARATQGDATTAGEKLCEILRQLTCTSSRIISVKSERLTLLRLLKKLGKHAAETRK